MTKRASSNQRRWAQDPAHRRSGAGGRLLSWQSSPAANSARALSLVAATVPVVLPIDLDAAGGNRRLAQRVAVWRAASAPLLNDHRLVRDMEPTLLRGIRDRVASDETVAAARNTTCDELLWPLSSMLDRKS